MLKIIPTKEYILIHHFLIWIHQGIRNICLIVYRKLCFLDILRNIFRSKVVFGEGMFRTPCSRKNSEFQLDSFRIAYWWSSSIEVLCILYICLDINKEFISDRCICFHYNWKHEYPHTSCILLFRRPRSLVDCIEYICCLVLSMEHQVDICIFFSPSHIQKFLDKFSILGLNRSRNLENRMLHKHRSVCMVCRAGINIFLFRCYKSILMGIWYRSFWLCHNESFLDMCNINDFWKVEHFMGKECNNLLFCHKFAHLDIEDIFFDLSPNS